MEPELVADVYSKDPVLACDFYKLFKKRLENADFLQMSRDDRQNIFVAVFEICKLGSENSDPDVNREAVGLLTKMASDNFKHFEHVPGQAAQSTYLEDLEQAVTNIEVKNRSGALTLTKKQ